VVRFAKGEFYENQEPTIGAAFMTQTVNLGDFVEDANFDEKTWNAFHLGRKIWLNFCFFSVRTRTGSKTHLAPVPAQPDPDSLAHHAVGASPAQPARHRRNLFFKSILNDSWLYLKAQNRSTSRRRAGGATAPETHSLTHRAAGNPPALQRREVSLWTGSRPHCFFNFNIIKYLIFHEILLQICKFSGLQVWNLGYSGPRTIPGSCSYVLPWRLCSCLRKFEVSKSNQIFLEFFEFWC
jgi:hypothetical protein